MARITCLILDWGTKILSAVQCDQKPKKLKNERERRFETTNQSLKKKEKKKKNDGRELLGVKDQGCAEHPLSGR